ncbi:protein containing DUF1566 [Candidatus Magnetomorum sp. HK-1]|nr:protein containing DUF1566 [Candidatus Magnetomorum sp. HK-1]
MVLSITQNTCQYFFYYLLKDVDYFGKPFNSYKDALKACENLNLHGLSGWRLPTRQEKKRMNSVSKNQEIHPIINLGSGSMGVIWCIDDQDRIARR